jgi:hypothetical protein
MYPKHLKGEYMDQEKFDIGLRKSLEAEARHREQHNIRRSRKTKFSLPIENKAIYRRAAFVSGLPLYCVYVLINKGILTPYLTDDLDWYLLELVFPELVKSKIVIKAFLARFSKADRREVIENAGEGELECYARRSLEANPNMKRKELLGLMENRFPRINWVSKDESGNTHRQRCGAMIRRLRDSIKAKQRYSYRHARLETAEIEYLQTYLDESIQNLQSDLGNEFIVSQMPKDEENSARAMLETLIKRTTKGITTLAGFEDCFRLCGKDMPCRWAEYLSKLNINILTLAKKFANTTKGEELIRYSVALPEMTYDQVYGMKERLYFFNNIISIGLMLAEITSGPHYSDEYKIKAESLLVDYLDMDNQQLSEVEDWAFSLIFKKNWGRRK